MPGRGRPKSEKPLDKKVSIRFTTEEYTILLEYANTHKITVTQAIKLCVKADIFDTQE